MQARKTGKPQGHKRRWARCCHSLGDNTAEAWAAEAIAKIARGSTSPEPPSKERSGLRYLRSLLFKFRGFKRPRRGRRGPNAPPIASRP